MKCTKCENTLIKAKGLCARCYQREWKISNNPNWVPRVKLTKEEKQAKDKEYRNTHRAQLREKQREYYKKRGRVLRVSLEASLKSRFCTAKANAEKRNLEFALTFEMYSDLVKNKSCEYCGGSLPRTGSGLDRKDNYKGYTHDNSIPCCVRCNRIKSNILNYDEMRCVADALNRFHSVAKAV